MLFLKTDEDLSSPDPLLAPHEYRIQIAKQRSGLVCAKHAQQAGVLAQWPLLSLLVAGSKQLTAEPGLTGDAGVLLAGEATMAQPHAEMIHPAQAAGRQQEKYQLELWVASQSCQGLSKAALLPWQLQAKS